MSNHFIPQTNRNERRITAATSKKNIVISIARMSRVDVSDSCEGNLLSGGPWERCSRPRIGSFSRRPLFSTRASLVALLQWRQNARVLMAVIAVEGRPCRFQITTKSFISPIPVPSPYIRRCT